jgi:hypothetical protein
VLPFDSIAITITFSITRTQNHSILFHPIPSSTHIYIHSFFLPVVTEFVVFSPSIFIMSMRRLWKALVGSCSISIVVVGSVLLVGCTEDDARLLVVFFF